jgi:hypothetical protein
MMFLRKPFKTVAEFYQAVETLIEELKANGSTEEAARLDMLMRGVWTTGSELIGELMLSLGEMKGSFPKEVKHQIDDCHYFAKHYRRILGLS